MIETPSEQQLIEDGRRMREILDEPVMRRMLAALREQFIADWKSGKTVEDRERAHAKMSFLDDFATGANIVIGTGKRAEIEKGRREEQESKTAGTRNRGR